MGLEINTKPIVIYNVTVGLSNNCQGDATDHYDITMPTDRPGPPFRCS
jgi:hypothetical protein